MHLWIVYLDLCRWRRRRPVRAVKSANVRDSWIVPSYRLHAVIVRHEELDERAVGPRLLAEDRGELEAVVMLWVEVVGLAGAPTLPPPEERAPHVEIRLDRSNAVADAGADAACEPEARGSDLQQRDEHFTMLSRILSLVPSGSGRL